jgi:quercetin dioxygenase-like cupin family protein
VARAGSTSTGLMAMVTSSSPTETTWRTGPTAANECVQWAPGYRWKRGRSRCKTDGMTVLIHHGEGPSFSYAGQQVHVLAGEAGQPAGFAAMEIIIPAHFPGPIPHAHDQFDEGIYVLRGRLLVAGDGDPQEATEGSMFSAPRGHRHGFSNPYPEEALVLGIWSPADPHASRLLP